MSDGRSLILPFSLVPASASVTHTVSARKVAVWPVQVSALALFRQNVALRAQNAALKQALQGHAGTPFNQPLTAAKTVSDPSAGILTLPLLRKGMSVSVMAVEVRQCLTPRQRQVLALVLAGCPSKNIAADLGISQRTVENHRAAIMRRTGATSIPALTRLMIGVAQIGDCKGTIPHHGPQPAATRKALIAPE